MFRPVHRGRALWPLLSALVILAMWSSAVAGVSCSHRSGSPNHCLVQELALHPRVNVESRASKDAHCTGMQMSDGDTHQIPMGTSMEGGITSDSRPNGLLGGQIFSQAPIDPVSVGSVTASTEPCPCVMHSPSDSSSASQVVLSSGSCLRFVVAEARGPLLLTLPSLIAEVYLHDHGPPGAVAPRYVLNSTFRI